MLQESKNSVISVPCSCISVHRVWSEQTCLQVHRQVDCVPPPAWCSGLQTTAGSSSETQRDAGSAGTSSPATQQQNSCSAPSTVNNNEMFTFPHILKQIRLQHYYLHTSFSLLNPLLYHKDKQKRQYKYNFSYRFKSIMAAWMKYNK